MPKIYNKPVWAVFSILMEIITSLLFLNLFVGVVVETYYKQKDNVSGLGSLTRNQISYINNMILGYQSKPLLYNKENDENSGIRNLCIKIANHPLFEIIVAVCIISNTIVLAIYWYD